jgi:hypothetical protein
MKEDGDENPGFVPKTIEYFRTEVEIIPLSPPKLLKPCIFCMAFFVNEPKACFKVKWNKKR